MFIISTILSFQGTVAVVSLLTGSVVARFYGDTTGQQLLGNGTAGNETMGFEDMDASASLPDDVKIGIVMSLALLVGIAQVSHSYCAHNVYHLAFSKQRIEK